MEAPRPRIWPDLVSDIYAWGAQRLDGLACLPWAQAKNAMAIFISLERFF